MTARKRKPMDKELFNADTCVIVKKDWKNRITRLNQKEWLEIDITSIPDKCKQEWLKDNGLSARAPSVYDFEALWQMGKTRGTNSLHSHRKMKRTDYDIVMVITDWMDFYSSDRVIKCLLEAGFGDWLKNDEDCTIEEAMKSYKEATIGKWEPYYRTSLCDLSDSVPNYWINLEAGIKLECPDTYQEPDSAADAIFKQGLGVPLSSAEVFNIARKSDPWLPFRISSLR